MVYSKGHRVLIAGESLARVTRTYSNSTKYMVKRDDGTALVVQKQQLTYIGRRPQSV